MLLNECNILKQQNQILEQKKASYESEINQIKLEAEKSQYELKEAFNQKEREMVASHEQEVQDLQDTVHSLELNVKS